MIQLATVLGNKTTRGATFMAPCPVCHKRRQARQTWYRVLNTTVVVCPACASRYAVAEVKEVCERQGWITTVDNYNEYVMSTRFLKGVSILCGAH